MLLRAHHTDIRRTINFRNGGFTMSDDKQVNPVDQTHEEQGRATVSPQAINWKDSCVIPPWSINVRAKQKTRELSANDFDSVMDDKTND
jgi:hypothetical protein